MSPAFNSDNLALIREDREFKAELCGHHLRFVTTWGLFSPREIDEGTRLLLEYIVVDDAKRILDLGCGYGALGLVLARSAPQAQVLLVDKDFVAIEYARKNASLNNIQNAEAHLSNGLSHVEGGGFDLAVTNLPAKSGKELYYIMFHDVFQRLQPGGSFYIVTITGLRQFVKRAFTEVFGNYKKLKQGANYTVAVARRTE